MRFTVTQKIVTSFALILVIGMVAMIIVYDGLHKVKIAMIELAEEKNRSSRPPMKWKSTCVLALRSLLMTREKILVVDDEAGICFGIRDFLESRGYEVDEADSCQGMLEVFRRARPDAVIVDNLLPDGHALDLLPRVKDIDPSIPIVILTAHGSIDLAVRAVQEGAVIQWRVQHQAPVPVSKPT